MKARMLKGQVEAMMAVLGLKGSTIGFTFACSHSVEIHGPEIRSTQDVLASFGVNLRLLDIDGQGAGHLAVLGFSKKLPSTKKLVETMKRIGHALPTNDKGETVNIGSETYGSKTMVYLRLDSIATRREVERKLAILGCKVTEDYHPGSASVEVQVSYKKAFGWDA